MKQTSTTKPRKTIKLKIKKSTTNHNHSIPNLPTEILGEIFNRVSLPIKTITEFQNPTTNSTQISSLFSNPKFAESQTHLYTRPCILAQKGCHCHCHNNFLLIEGHHQNDSFLSMEINTDFLRDHASLESLEILGSCNGLLLLSDRRVLLVANPLTREIICVAEGEGFFNGDNSYYAIGYSAKSETYKVVKLVGSLREAVSGYYLEYSWHAEVITLGTDTWNITWRWIEGCDSVLQNAIIEDKGRVVMIEGDLYWLTHIGQRQEIVKFDIDSEEFGLSSSPLDEQGLGFGFSLSSLGVVDDMLCVARYKRRGRRSCNDVPSHGMELWVSDCGVWRIWRKISMICIENNVWCDGRFEVIKASENEEEMLLMIQDPLKLVYYDAKKNTVREAQIDGVECCKKMKGLVFCPNLRSIRECIKA